MHGQTCCFDGDDYIVNLRRGHLQLTSVKSAGAAWRVRRRPLMPAAAPCVSQSVADVPELDMDWIHPWIR